MLNLVDITIFFQDKPALDRISLTLETGRTTILIGPSGCGKSTLLRSVIGLVAPDAGRIEFAGTELGPGNLAEARRRIGYVIQSGGLFPHLTAWKNISIAAESSGWKSDAISDRIEELLHLVRLPADTLGRYPSQLSGGQQQRICLMRALMLNPDLLLLDEPLAALDPMVRADLQTDLRHVFQSLSKTVLFVTHDMGEAMFFGDRIVLMREGGIVQSGRPEELVNHPSDPFVTRFIQAQRNPSERQTTI